MARRIKKVIDPIFPADSLQRRIVKKILKTLHLRKYAPGDYYAMWVDQHSMRPDMRPADEVMLTGPLISVVVPVFNTPQRYLEPLVYSIVSQSYSNWELVLVDASTEKAASDRIQHAAGTDKRIQVIRTKNAGISNNTNVGIEAARGEYIAFADHDDTLDAFALSEVALAIKNYKADLIYSDEDKITDNGSRHFDAHFKPDWSPDLLTHVNYINHLTVIRKSLVEKVGLLDPKMDGAQDYDLLLRVVDTDPVIYHIPKVLYHWRAAQNSTAQDFNSKPQIAQAAQNALTAHFARQKVDATVTLKFNRPGFYDITHVPYKDLSIIVTPFAPDVVLRSFIELFLTRTKTKTKLHLVIPEGAMPRIHTGGVAITQLPADERFLPDAVRAAKYEQVMVLSQIVLPSDEDWPERLTGYLRLKHIAALTPLITHQDNKIEDCGLVRAADGLLQKLFFDHTLGSQQTYFGNSEWVRNVDALSGACVMTRKDDLTKYFTADFKGVNFAEHLQQYTLDAVRRGSFVTVIPDMQFDSYSIRMQPHLSRRSHFNPNLVNMGSDYELYTPPTTALFILQQLHEEAGNDQ